MTTTKKILSIYLTNLGKYNEGYLIGEWLNLPATDDEIEDGL
ncbi:MAG: antirestriction protein ArdA [Ruminococcus bromii]|nr:antirestriction protein ArdA [Ruminococcus bromii]